MCETLANKKRNQAPLPISLKLGTRADLNQKQNCKSKMMQPIDLKESGSMQLSMLISDMIGSSTKPVAY
jgi:hypothetical protein